MDRKLEIETTADGSATIYLPDLDEHYHSVKGALTESQHIFINCGLAYSKCAKPRVLEIGFGTGLNAILTAIYSIEHSVEVHYTTLELYPLSEEIIANLGYEKLIDAKYHNLFKAIHTCAWDTDVAITPTFTIHKCKCDFTNKTYSERYDVVYFDAFAPEKQQEMWDDTLFTRIYNALNSNAVLTTYCAKGEVRRSLQRSGFTVERLAGPIGGKREILRAVK